MRFFAHRMRPFGSACTGQRPMIRDDVERSNLVRPFRRTTFHQAPRIRLRTPWCLLRDDPRGPDCTALFASAGWRRAPHRRGAHRRRLLARNTESFSPRPPRRIRDNAEPYSRRPGLNQPSLGGSRRRTNRTRVPRCHCALVQVRCDREHPPPGWHVGTSHLAAELLRTHRAHARRYASRSAVYRDEPDAME